MSGLPAMSRTFLRGRPSEPPRAGRMASTYGLDMGRGHRVGRPGRRPDEPPVPELQVDELPEKERIAELGRCRIAVVLFEERAAIDVAGLGERRVVDQGGTLG